MSDDMLLLHLKYLQILWLA